MFKVLLLSLVLIGSVSFAKGKVVPPRDPAAAEEEETDPCRDESTMGMINCNNKQMIVARKNLASTLKKIRNAIKTDYSDNSKELLSRLFRMNKSYQVYAADECRFQAGQMVGGSGEGAIFSACYLDMMKKHLASLEQTGSVYFEK